MRKTGPLRVIIDVKGMAEVDEEDLKQQIVVLQEHFLFNTLNAIKGAAILEGIAAGAAGWFCGLPALSVSMFSRQ